MIDTPNRAPPAVTECMSNLRDKPIVKLLLRGRAADRLANCHKALKP